jgi:hypothetical protein
MSETAKAASYIYSMCVLTDLARYIAIREAKERPVACVIEGYTGQVRQITLDRLIDRAGGEV